MTRDDFETHPSGTFKALDESTQALRAMTVQIDECLVRHTNKDPYKRPRADRQRHGSTND